MKIIKYKYRKMHKPKYNKVLKELKGLTLLHGTVALIADEVGYLTMTQLNSVRLTIKKIVKKLGLLSVRVSANRMVTSKPLEIRMGKGKGTFSHSITLVKRGTVLFELSGGKKTQNLLKNALIKSGEKLPIKSVVRIYKS